MAEEPAENSTRHRLRVRFGETDLMGIAHHASYLSYFEEGRVEYLRRRGIEYASWMAEQIHLPVVDARLKYRRPARFDDLLIVDTTIGQMGRASLRFDYRVSREAADGTLELVCEGSTRLACVDNAHRLRRIPERVITALEASELA